jgi:cation transport ATPase
MEKTAAQDIGEVTAPVKLQRRSSRKKHHRSGLAIVWSMVVLMLAFYTARLFLTFQGHIHPVLANAPTLADTSLTAYILFAGIGLFCLFLLVRGNRPIRSIYGAICAISAIIYASFFSNSFVTEAGTMWLSMDLLAIVATTYAAWTCLLSRRAERYLSNERVAL